MGGDPGGGPPAIHFGVTLSAAGRRPALEAPSLRRPCPTPAEHVGGHGATLFRTVQPSDQG